MRVKTATRSRLKPTRSSCHTPASSLFDLQEGQSLQPPVLSHQQRLVISSQGTIGYRERGAVTGLLGLFVIAVLVTAVVALLLGHKIGYQRGYYSLQEKAEQAAATSEQATTELKDLRLSNKVMSNQVQTAKQELNISLTNLGELRETQKQLNVENRQVTQLNQLYAQIIADKGGMPLQVLGAKIEPLPENAFEYGFDIGMLSEDGQAKSLAVTLTLQDKDSFVEVPLEPSRYAIEGVVRIRGRFVMPSGFKPLQVKLNLEAGDEQVEQLYDWRLGDMVDNMPLSLLDLPEVDASPITSTQPARAVTKTDNNKSDTKK